MQYEEQMYVVNMYFLERGAAKNFPMYFSRISSLWSVNFSSIRIDLHIVFMSSLSNQTKFLRLTPQKGYYLLELSNYIGLEIKSFGLGTRIRDMEAEWRMRVITNNISW